METNATTLKTYFEAGDFPTQSQFSDFIESYPNNLDNHILDLIDQDFVPIAPALKVTAQPILKGWNDIATWNTPDGGILLPAALIKRTVTIRNNNNYSVKIWAANTNTIQGLVTADPIILNMNNHVTFYCLANGNWHYTIIDNLANPYAPIGFGYGLIDVTPSVQATALPLVNQYNNITTAHVVLGGVKLPYAYVGTQVVVYNSGGFATDVYPLLGQSIEWRAANIPLNVLNTEVVIFTCYFLGIWNVTYSTATPTGTSVAEPADPATTASGTGVMMGLALSFTPKRTGRMLLKFNGDTDNTTSNDGTLIQIRTGTGAAPANGAALTGTTRGRLIRSNNNTALAGGWNILPVSSHRYENFTVGTTYWLDISLATVGGGTARVRDIEISAIELDLNQ